MAFSDLDLSSNRVALWTPEEERVEGSEMRRFQRWLAATRGVETCGYAELHEWSVGHLEDFWESLWEFFGIRHSKPFNEVIEGESMPGVRWFTGATLNYAENVLRHVESRPDDIALTGMFEDLPDRHLTWRQLVGQVAHCADELRRAGVKVGDRVAGALPNIPQTVVAMLATTSLGAVWSVVNPDFGVKGIVDRFAQIQPKILLVCDGYRFNGAVRDTMGIVGDLRVAMPSVETVLVLEHLGSDVAGEAPAGAILVSLSDEFDVSLCFEQVDFSHPLWIVYSSGTTGRPKAIVHSHGGIVMEASKSARLQYELGPGDKTYFAAATTWVLWNLLVGTMLAGASVVTYDGSPVHGGKARHFSNCAAAGVTFFGAGAAVLSMIEKSGAEPGAESDLSSLKTILATGSPVPESTWGWVRDHIGPQVKLSSDSGGTDVATSFFGMNPLEPIVAGRMQGPYLGVAAESWDDDGRRIYDQVGEFVVTQPMPSMPIAMWGDEDGSRYRDAYFTVYPGIWHHGDWITEFRDGGFVVHGRSDSTINRGGIRMGSADICQVIDSLDGVAGSMVIGAELGNGDYYMPLFVQLEDGFSLTDELRDQIRDEIRDKVSPRYVPDEFIEVPGLPVTRTGKLMEVPIKRLFQGMGDGQLDREAAADASVVDWYVQRAADYRAWRSGDGQ